MSEYANAPQPRELQPVRDTELPLGTHVMKVQELLSYFPSPHSNEDVSEDFVEAPHTHRSTPLDKAQIPTFLSATLLADPPTQNEVRGQLEQYMHDVPELMLHAEATMRELKLRLITDAHDNEDAAEFRREIGAALGLPESPDSEQSKLGAPNEKIYELDKLTIDGAVLDEFRTIGTPQFHWKDAMFSRASDMVKVRIKDEKTGEWRIVDTPLDNLILTVMAKYPHMHREWVSGRVLSDSNFSEGSALRDSLSNYLLESLKSEDWDTVDQILLGAPLPLDPRTSILVDDIYAKWEKQDTHSLSNKDETRIFWMAYNKSCHTDNMKVRIVEMARAANDSLLMESAVLMDAIPKDDPLWLQIDKKAEDFMQDRIYVGAGLLRALIKTGHRSFEESVSQLCQHGHLSMTQHLLTTPDMKEFVPDDFQLTDEQSLGFTRYADEETLDNLNNIYSYLSEDQQERVQKIVGEIIARFTADPIENRFLASYFTEIRNLLSDNQREQLTALLAQHAQAESEYQRSFFWAGVRLLPTDTQTQAQLADRSLDCGSSGEITSCIQKGWLTPDHTDRLMQKCMDESDSDDLTQYPYLDLPGDLYDNSILSGLLGANNIDSLASTHPNNAEHIDYLKLKIGISAHELAQKIRQGEELSKEEQMRLLVSVFRKPKMGEAGTAGFAIPFHPQPVRQTTEAA